MTLLERAGDFYAALVSERKPHDPAVLQFRTFLVQQFQQAGMQAADKVDRARRDGTPIQPILVVGKPAKPLKTSEPAYAKGFKPTAEQVSSGKPKFRNFEHPAEGTGKPKAPLGGREMLGKIRGRFQDQPEASIQDDDLLDTSAEQRTTSQAAESTKAASTTKESGKAAAVAAAKPASMKLTPAEKEDIAGMQPSVVVKHYSKERIVAYLSANSVKFNPDASHRQLAATLVGHLKRKG